MHRVWHRHHYCRWLIFISLPSLIGLLVQVAPVPEECDESPVAPSPPPSPPPGLPDAPPARQEPLCGWVGVDNFLVPFFAVGASLWAALFLEFSQGPTHSALPTPCTSP